MGCVSSKKLKRRGSARYDADDDDGDGTAPTKRPGSGGSSGSKRSSRHRRSRSADRDDGGKRSGGANGSRESSRSNKGHRRSQSASKERESKRDRGSGGALLGADHQQQHQQPPGSFADSSASASTIGSDGWQHSLDWQSRAAMLTSSSAHEAQEAGAEFDDWQRGMLDILEEQSIQAYDMDTSQIAPEGAGNTAAGQGRRYSNSLLGFSSQSHAHAPFSIDSPAAAVTGRHGRHPLGGRANSSAFSFGSLSALDGSAAASALQLHPPVPAHPTILVVDEHPSTRAIISKWLTNSKFTEISCATGDQAQSILAPAAGQPAHSVDVIVADVNVIVEGSGTGSSSPMLLLDWVINAAPCIASIPVIVLSSNLPSQGLERLLRRGAWDALHKPLNRAVFLNALATVFNTRRQKLFVERLRAKGDEYKERYMSRAKLVYSSKAQHNSLSQSQSQSQSLQHPLAPPSRSAQPSAPGSAASSMPTTPHFATHAFVTPQQQQSQQQSQQQMTASPQSGRGSLQLPGNGSSNSSSAVAQPITVLVVESDPVIIAQLTEWIQTSSVRLRVVNTLAEAVTLLRESQKQAVMAASTSASNHSPPFFHVHPASAAATMLGGGSPLLGGSGSGSGGMHRLVGHRSMSAAHSPSPLLTGTSPVLTAAPAPVSLTAAPSSAAASIGSVSASIVSTTATAADESVNPTASALDAPSSSVSSTPPSLTNGDGAAAAPTAAESAGNASSTKELTPPLPPLPPPASSASLPLGPAVPRYPSLPGAVPSSPLLSTSPLPWHSRLSPLPHATAAAGFGIELIIVSHDMLIPPEVSAELMGMSATDPAVAAATAPPAAGAESSGDESGDEGLAAVAGSGTGATGSARAAAAAPRTARTTVFMSSGLAASQILVDLTLQPVLGKRRKLPVICMCDAEGPSPVGMALLKHVALTIFNRPLSQGLVNKKMSLLLELIEQNRLGLLLARRANMYKSLLAQLQSPVLDATDVLEGGLDDHGAASAPPPHTPGRRVGHGEFRSRLLSVERDHRMRASQSGGGAHGSPTRLPINDKRRGSNARAASSDPPSPGASLHHPSFLITPDLGPGIASDSSAVMSSPPSSPVPPSLALNTNLSLRAPTHRSHSAASSSDGSISGGSGSFELPPAQVSRGRQHSDGSSGGGPTLQAPHASSRAMVSSSMLLHAAESQALHAPPRTNTPPIVVNRPVLRIRTDSANA